MINEILARKANQWIALNTDDTIATALSYNRVFISITDPVTLLLSQYDLLQFSTINSVSSSLTILEFITAFNTAYPQSQTRTLSLASQKVINYYTLWDYGLVANRINPSNLALSPNPNNLPDLSITISNNLWGNVNGFQNNLLFLINGVIAPETYLPSSILIRHGSLLIDTNPQQTIGVLDFTALGGYTRQYFTASDIAQFSSTNTSATYHITLATPLTGSPVLVLNGRVHLFEDIFKVINPTTLAVTLSYEMVVKEAFTAEPSLLNWMSRVDAESTGFNVGTFNAINYLTQLSSFLITVNGALSYTDVPVIDTGLGNARLTFSDITDIIFLSDGTIGYYVVNEMLSDFNTVLSVSDPLTSNLLADTEVITSNAVVSSQPLNSIKKSNPIQCKHLYIL
jgi:hypothetical protein